MKLKKVLAFVLCVAMVLSTMSFNVFAADENTDVAKIGEVSYPSLAEALATAKDMTGEVTVEIYDKVTLDSGLSGNYSSIKFVGKAESAEIYLDVQGYITATGKAVAFEDLKLSKSAGGYIANAGFMNVAFGVYDVDSVSYTSCTFLNGAYASSGDVTFTGCTFYKSNDKYGLWAYGDVNAVVDGCVFADYRGIKMYAEGAAKTTNLTVKDTDFSAVTDKPAIVLTYGESVTLEGNNYSSTGVFELDKAGAPNGTTVTSADKITCVNDDGACGVLVGDKIYTTVADAAKVAKAGDTVSLLHDSDEKVELETDVFLVTNGYKADSVIGLVPVAKIGDKYYKTLTDAVKEAQKGDTIVVYSNLNELATIVNNGKTLNGLTIKLGADIDLNNEEWTPIGNSAYSFQGTFDGDNHTISNLLITGNKNDSGLFGFTANGEIKNLTVENASVSGRLDVGVVAGTPYTSKYTNITVKGRVEVNGMSYVGGVGGKNAYANWTDITVDVDDKSYVKATSTENGKSYRTYVGGVIGFMGEGSHTVANVKSNIAVIGDVCDIGGIVGIAHYGNNFENVTCSGSVTNTNTDPELAAETGGIAGVWHNEKGQKVTFKNCAYTGNSDVAVVGAAYNANNTTADNSGSLIIDNNISWPNAATIGTTVYASLKDAVDAAKDDDVIKLTQDVVITEASRVHNSDDYYDGIYYIGDKSFTINLAGHTITHDGSVNDYLLNFKNIGEKANEITITNGTVDAGTKAYSAICTATTSTQKITINLENVELVNNNSNGAVAKIRGGAVLNVNGGTVVKGNDSYVGIESVASVVNIYDGAEIYQNGTSSYVGSLVGVSNNGTLNVYGGYGKSAKGGFIAMTSGGTINVSGGEWIANSDGTYANDNNSVLIAQSANGAKSVINVTGGQFAGGYNCYGNAVGDAQINIAGGMFDQDPAAYIAPTSEAIDRGAYEYPYGVAPKAAAKINVTLEETSNKNVYDIVINSDGAYDIYEFVSAELTFANNSTTVGGSYMDYEIRGYATNKTFAQEAKDAVGLKDNEEQYIISLNDGAERLSGDGIIIGQVEFFGQGTLDFSITKGKVATTWQNTNLGRYYDAAAGTLVLKDAAINDNIPEVHRNVAVNVAFNHNIYNDKQDKSWDNYQITATLKNNAMNWSKELDVTIEDIKSGACVFENVPVGYITVTLKAPGFRTYTYETTLEETKDNGVLVLNFWNDVKDGNDEAIEKGKATMAHNFVVGDIVMDYIVDKYDLAAVTSYYGMYNIKNNAKYIKYDLNRDGNIDIRDVQYVLHTMGN